MIQRLNDMLRRAVYDLFWVATFFGSKILFFRVDVKGAHHIPQKGAYIVASNHVGHLDPYILGIIFPRHMCYMTNPGQFRIPIWGITLSFIETIEGSGFKAMRQALKRLSEGRIVVFFPEGERVKTGAMRVYKPGVGASALWTGAKVIPVRISGTGAALDVRTASLRPGSRITVSIGEPVTFDSFFYEGKVAHNAASATDIIVEKINALALDGA
ncbi:MAG TPA: lysophospholipid acyltransferase family protein [Candidatus Omnitrophota bacterium]|nr:lysophospholipid acyltransferase family protein [Candidatus Omnitrophota bacterium]